MARFDSIYPFTTENIAGYMKSLNLTGAKVITVTGSTDHVINIALQGSKDITTFDINPLAEKYMHLKLSALRSLSYEDFLRFLLYDSPSILSYEIVSMLEMPEETKKFWLQKLSEFQNNGQDLSKSNLFNRKYFNPDSKLWQNLYLNKSSYLQAQERVRNTNITFINSSLENLELTNSFDYMFLSNISDYISMMFGKEGLIKYRELLSKFLRQVREIYMAYLYDIGNSNPRSEIDDLNKINKLFTNYEIKKFRSALETNEELNDGVIILRR